MKIDMYNDFMHAWAEYEYIRLQIISDLDDIIDKYEYSFKDITVTDNIIEIKVSPAIPMEMLTEIRNYLGIDGQISTTKKSNNVYIVFEQTKEE